MALRRVAKRTARQQFQPARRELDALLKSARRSLKEGTRAERIAARAIIQSSKAARPEVRKGYREATRTANRANRIVEQDVPEQSIFDDAIAQEIAGFRRRTGEAKAYEIGELANRGVRAVDAQVANTRALQGEFREQKREIQGERRDLAREEGAAFLDLLNQLRAERADRRDARADRRLDQAKHNLDVQEFNLRAEDVRTDNRRQARENRPDAKGGGLTPAQRRDRTDDIRKARSWLKMLTNAGLSLGEARATLVRRTPVPVGGTNQTPPDIPAQYVDRAVREMRGSNRRSGGGLKGFFDRLWD